MSSSETCVVSELQCTRGSSTHMVAGFYFEKVLSFKAYLQYERLRRSSGDRVHALTGRIPSMWASAVAETCPLSTEQIAQTGRFSK